MKLTPLLILLLTVSISCIQKPEENGLGGFIDEEELFNEFAADINSEMNNFIPQIDTLIIDTLLIDFSNQMIDLLDRNKLMNFANHFHPVKGCSFAPYTYIEGDEQNFKSTTFEVPLVSEDVLTWGMADGSGEPIELSVKDYFKRFVYDVDFKYKATDIHINGNLAFSNTLDNIHTLFPNADFIEFYFEGSTEYQGMDWSSLTFYIEKFNDTYYLVAVVHNEWTI